MVQITGWIEVDDHAKVRPYKCVWCKRQVGTYRPVFYLVKGKCWIPYCCRNCRDQQLARWAALKDIRAESQMGLF